jgi:hypothetical protein
VLGGGAGDGQCLVGGGGLAGPGGLVASDDDRVFGVGVQPGEAEVGEGAGPGGAQPGDEGWWGAAVISLAAPWRGEVIQARLPVSSVRARNGSPCFSWLPL